MSGGAEITYRAGIIQPRLLNFIFLFYFILSFLSFFPLSIFAFSSFIFFASFHGSGSDSEDKVKIVKYASAYEIAKRKGRKTSRSSLMMQDGS